MPLFIPPDPLEVQPRLGAALLPLQRPAETELGIPVIIRERRRLPVQLLGQGELSRRERLPRLRQHRCDGALGRQLTLTRSAQQPQAQQDSQDEPEQRWPDEWEYVNSRQQGKLSP